MTNEEQVCDCGKSKFWGSDCETCPAGIRERTTQQLLSKLVTEHILPRSVAEDYGLKKLVTKRDSPAVKHVSVQTGFLTRAGEKFEPL